MKTFLYIFLQILFAGNIWMCVATTNNSVANSRISSPNFITDFKSYENQCKTSSGKNKPPIDSSIVEIILYLLH
jgi:hypothetical protein